MSETKIPIKALTAGDVKKILNSVINSGTELNLKSDEILGVLRALCFKLEKEVEYPIDNGEKLKLIPPIKTKSSVKEDSKVSIIDRIDKFFNLGNLFNRKYYDTKSKVIEIMEHTIDQELKKQAYQNTPPSDIDSKNVKSEKLYEMKKLTAKEAAKISEKNSISLNKVFYSIKIRAELGERVAYAQKMPEQMVKELNGLGFSVEEISDNSVRIKW